MQTTDCLGNNAPYSLTVRHLDAWLAGRRLWALLTLLLIAASARAYVLWGPTNWGPHTVEGEQNGPYIVPGMHLSGDPGPTYDRLARNFLAGRGMILSKEHRQGIRGPLYPLLLSGLYQIFGQRLWPVGVVHAVFGVITCGLVWKIARESYGETAGAIAGLGMALLPEALRYTHRVSAQSLMVLFITSGIALLLTTNRRLPLPRVGWAGCAFGAAALTRPETLMLILAPAYWLCRFSEERGRSPWSAVSVLFLGCAIVLAPEAARVVSSAEVRSAYVRLGLRAMGLESRLLPPADDTSEPSSPPASLDAPDVPDEPQAFSYVGYAQRRAWNFIRLWSLRAEPPPPLRVFVAYWALLGAAVAGYVFMRRSRASSLLAAVVVAVTALYVIMHAHPRYRMPAMSSVIVLSSVGGLWAVSRVTHVLRGVAWRRQNSCVTGGGEP